MDTRGRAYSKALQQLTTGVYLAELCLIGLMAIATGSSSAAIGPLVLMIIFLVATILFHVLLRQAMSAMMDDLADDTFGRKGSDEENAINKKMHNISATKGKVFDKYATYLCRILRVPELPHVCEHLKTPICVYTKAEEEEAYMNPSLSCRPPIIWTVNDKVGIFEREKKAMSEIAEVTDEAVWWDDKGKLTAVWCLHENQVDENVLQASPLWEKPVHY